MSNGAILSVIPTLQSTTLLARQARALKRKKKRGRGMIKDFAAVSFGVPIIKATSDIIKII